MRGDRTRAVELHGRLGNQLFQFAMLKAQLERDDPVLVETIAAGDALGSALRAGTYRVLRPAESLALGRPPSCSGRPRQLLSGAVRRLPGGGRSGALGRHVYVEREQGHHDPGVSAAPSPVLFMGFFQHEGYFVHRSDEVLAALLPRSEATRPFELGDGVPSVAVVIRAGADYAQIGWDLPWSWYREAVESVVEGLPAARFLVCSDIPMVADGFAASLADLGAATAVRGLSPLDQLHLISDCDHAVAASSSFAWWGAWLGDARRGFPADRRVAAPDPWIVPGQDTVPARWLRRAAVLRADARPPKIGR